MLHAALDFAQPTALGFAEAMVRFARAGVHTFLLADPHPTLRDAVQLAAAMLGDRADRVRWRLEPSVAAASLMPWPAWNEGEPGQEVCRVWLVEEAEALDDRLHAFIDRPATILAPALSPPLVPCTTVTVPKSGTHLLFELLDELGYPHCGPLPAEPRPRERYFPATTSHLPFREVESLPEFDAIDGGYAHPLWRHPIVFIYRNPLDVLCSEAAWFARRGATYLAHHYAQFDRDERLLRLIHGDAALPSLRERLYSYAGWLELPGVIPVSYEELVGERGGGDAALQAKTVWAMQLKLHVPGSPQNYARMLARRGARTFHRGVVRRYLEELKPAHLAAIRAQGTEYFTPFGYELDELLAGRCLPRHVDRYRARRLRTTAAACRVVAPTLPADFAQETAPLAAVQTYKGHRLVRVRHLWLAVPAELEEFRFPDHLGTPHVKTAVRFDELLAAIDDDPLGDDPLAARPDLADGIFDSGVGGGQNDPLLLKSNSKLHNIVVFRGTYYAIHRRLGKLDLFTLGDAEIPGILKGRSYEEIDRLALESAAAEMQANRDAERHLWEERTPLLVDQTAPEHNIVLFRRRYYAVPRALGAVNFLKPQELANPAIREAATLDEARQAIGATAGQPGGTSGGRGESAGKCEST